MRSRVGSGRAVLMGLMAAGLSACAGEADPTPYHVAAPNTVVLPLADKLPPGAEPVGIAITPSGKQYVLDRNSGLHLVEPAAATLVFDTNDLDRFGLPPGMEFTDVAAMDEDRFLLTAPNDGYLWDRGSGTFTSYFCYLPDVSAVPVEDDVEPAPNAPDLNAGDDPAPVLSMSQTLQASGIPVEQRTESVGYNGVSLFAQPRTVRGDTGESAAAELFTFANIGGQPTRVTSMTDPQFLAGGMVPDGETLILGERNVLYRATLNLGYSAVHTLAEGVKVTGMARTIDGNLVVLDGNSKSLIPVRANELLE